MSCEECGLVISLRARVDELETRIEHYERELSEDTYKSPPEWCLTGQQEVCARLLAARVQLTAEQIAAAWGGTEDKLFRAHRPGSERGRDQVKAVMSNLRTKLADFGWVIMLARNGFYRIHPAQHEAFKAAMRGDGQIAHLAMTAKKGRAA